MVLQLLSGMVLVSGVMVAPNISFWYGAGFWRFGSSKLRPTVIEPSQKHVKRITICLLL
jgi:hypothetical protein